MRKKQASSWKGNRQLVIARLCVLRVSHLFLTHAHGDLQATPSRTSTEEKDSWLSELSSLSLSLSVCLCVSVRAFSDTSSLIFGCT
ncbi:MAG: hypothetical protein ACK41O_27440 [Runella zeae]